MSRSGHTSAHSERERSATGDDFKDIVLHVPTELVQQILQETPVESGVQRMLQLQGLKSGKPTLVLVEKQRGGSFTEVSRYTGSEALLKRSTVAIDRGAVTPEQKVDIASVSVSDASYEFSSDESNAAMGDSVAAGISSGLAVDH